jgi:hypothetical protein
MGIMETMKDITRKDGGVGNDSIVTYSTTQRSSIGNFSVLLISNKGQVIGFTENPHPWISNLLRSNTGVSEKQKFNSQIKGQRLPTG